MSRSTGSIALDGMKPTSSDEECDLLVQEAPEVLTTIGDGGMWNWAFLGPEPVSLPLVGYGSKGFEEMKACYNQSCGGDQYANLYGLLRLDFGAIANKVTKFVFMRVSRANEADLGHSVMKLGRAQAVKGAMEKTMSEYCSMSLFLEFCSLEEFCLDSIITRLRKVAISDNDMICAEQLAHAEEQYQEMLPHLEEEYKEMIKESEENDDTLANVQKKSRAARYRRRARSLVKQRKAPKPEFGKFEWQQAGSDLEVQSAEVPPPPLPSFKTAVDAQAEDGNENMGNQGSAHRDFNGKGGMTSTVSGRRAPTDVQAEYRPDQAQRRSILDESGRIFRKRPRRERWEVNSSVAVYCKDRSQWLDDGVIVDVLQEPETQSGKDLPAGSVLVRYHNKSQMRWLLPDHKGVFVVLSQRPRLPASYEGEMSKEGVTGSKRRFFFYVSDGVLQWWHSKEEATSGKPNVNSISLLDLEMRAGKNQICVRSECTNGFIHTFFLESSEEMLKWERNLKRHGRFSLALAKYLATQAEQEDDAKDGNKRSSTGSNEQVYTKPDSPKRVSPPDNSRLQAAPPKRRDRTSLLPNEEKPPASPKGGSSPPKVEKSHSGLTKTRMPQPVPEKPRASLGAGPPPAIAVHRQSEDRSRKMAAALGLRAH